MLGRNSFNFVIITKRFSLSVVNKVMMDETDKQLQNSQMSEKRTKFLEQEKQMECQVQFDQLTEDERKIHECHRQACLRGHFTYDDPVTGLREFTRLRHFLRGVCCGSACRHCIYNHTKVPEFKKKTRRFNSSYWIYDQNEEENPSFNEEEMMKLRRPKTRSI